jgi:hypothetical protein
MTKTFLNVFIILLIFTFFSSCKKEKDYRDHYIGDYNFIIHKHVFKVNDSTYFDTTINYGGQIVKEDYEYAVRICYLPDAVIYALLSENGNLSKSELAGQGWTFSGSFQTYDKVSFTYYLFGTWHYVIGDKK